MKRFVFGLALAAAMTSIAAVAPAADMVVKARPAAKYDPCGVARFSGFYVGGNTGAVAYTALRTDQDAYIEDAADLSANKIGITAGVQAGYDWQFCNKVFGVVADWNWADTETTARLFPNDPFVTEQSIQSKMDWFSTIRARAGLAVNDSLFYVTAGVAAAKIKSTITNINPPGAINEQFAFSATRWGFAGGAGAEFALWNNWSLNTEILYLQFKKNTETFFSATRNGFRTFEFNDSAWVGRAGLNYRWDNPRAAYAAANMAAAAPLYPCGPSRFNGGYIGGNAGAVSYTALRQDLQGYVNANADYSATETGFTAGAKLGWDWQSCNKLFGLVADWNWTDIDATARRDPNRAGFDRSTKGSMDWFATIRARAGLVVDDNLIYVTGGVAAAKIQSTITNIVSGSINEQFDISATRWGFAGGVGAEFALWSGWSLNTELLYMQFQKHIDTFRSPVRGSNQSFENHDSAWVRRVSLNYRWDNPRNAYAASMPVKGAAAYPCGPSRFSGFYAGGNVGAIRRTALLHDQDAYLGDNVQLTGTEGGLTAGAQAGFDWQSCHKVFGVVADWNWADAETAARIFPNVAGTDLSTRSNMDWFATLRTRSGIAMDDVLVYVTGGLAAAKIETKITNIDPPAVPEQLRFSDTRWGWTGGAGAEFALAGGWSANGEVLYMQFKTGTDTIHSPRRARFVSFEHSDSAWVGRAGLNYRWADMGKSPVVTKY